MARTLYILDGHSQIYRAYYAPFRDLSSPAGEPTRATFVFTQMFLRFLADRRPEYLAMAVDGPAVRLKRRQLFPAYKVTRKPMPDDLLPQIERIHQIVRAMNVPILAAEGYEADDVIATLVERFASPQTRVVLISRDKDLDQLVGENVVLLDPMKNETLDAAAIEKAKGYPPGRAVEVQALAGDSVDNVPGIPGVGPKTAAKLIAQYGTADAVLAHADELPPKLREAMRKNADHVAMARRLVTLERHVPLELDLESLRFRGVPAGTLRPIFRELGFNRLIEQLDAAAPPGEPVPAPPTVSTAPPPAAPPTVEGPSAPALLTSEGFDYRCVNTPEALDELLRQLRGVRRLGVDTETTSPRPMWCELVGLSLAWTPRAAVYLPLKAPLGLPVLERDRVRRVLGPVLADEAIEKVGQNLKFDLLVLARAGLELAGPMCDTMIAAHVLDSTRLSYKLDALAAEFLSQRCIPIEDLIGRGKNQITMDQVPLELITRYACEDADVALRLAGVLEEKLRAEGLEELFRNLEMPLMPVLADMERAGITVDPQALRRMEIDLGRQADALRGRIVAAGGEFNPDSPKQLAAVLFEKLRLPVQRRTQTGPSTDSDVLEQLAALHELPALVLDYRRLTKLLSTYLVALAACIHPQTRRVHTSFHQAGTVTGRLSSSDPNLQNIPIRTDEGRQIRSAFVAAPRCRLLSADYSQIELRILAHFCQDPTLLEAFRRDQDIHRIVAAEVFGVPIEDVAPAQRARAKTVNFGIIYGQTAVGLARTLRISRSEAAKFIAAYRKRFPKIDEFLAQCVAQAKERGCVETILGRRRRIPEIDARNPQRRAMAERMAINSVVQGSAADLIKKAMVSIAARIRREKRPGRMLLQIHDELLFEVPEQDVEAERDMIVAEMTGAIRLGVPLKVETGVGLNWMEAK